MATTVPLGVMLRERDDKFFAKEKLKRGEEFYKLIMEAVYSMISEAEIVGDVTAPADYYKYSLVEDTIKRLREEGVDVRCTMSEDDELEVFRISLIKGMLHFEAVEILRRQFHDNCVERICNLVRSSTEGMSYKVTDFTFLDQEWKVLDDVKKTLWDTHRLKVSRSSYGGTYEVSWREATTEGA